MKKILSTTFVLLGLACIFLYNCKTKCRDITRSYYDFSEADKKVSPYYGKDTLRFRSKSNMLNILYGSGVNDTYDNRETQSETSDCPGDRYSYPTYATTYRNSTSTGKDIYLKLYYDPADAQPYIYITFNGKIFKEHTGQLPPPPSPSYQLDSLLINNKMYFQIRSINGNIAGDTLFYNREVGILRIVAGTETYQRVP
jgi:hypothetical protein